ncbi:MAG TPA: endopeptidase La, partial [Lachnospiraceae bacterium]
MMEIKETKVRYLPSIALRGTTILPEMIVHFDISREKSIRAIEEAMMEEELIYLITQKEAETEDPGRDDLYSVGTIAKIKQVMKLPKDTLRILVEGIEKAELLSLSRQDDYLEAETLALKEEDLEVTDSVKVAMAEALKSLFADYCSGNPRMAKELKEQILSCEKFEDLLSQIGINLLVDFKEKQKILEALTVEERYETVGILLGNEIEKNRIREELQQKIKDRIDKNQREYILREQLKIIKEELGEDTNSSDLAKFEEKVKKLKASGEIKEKIKEEIKRFKTINPHSPESAVARAYVETLLNLPWDKTSKDNHDLSEAKEILKKEHYGLEKVKERILEFLAVRTMTKGASSPILCLVGPPGTGKTSIGRSIARAMNKEYVRISLGGVRDEAEIRGHRRTYVGAMPGRIIKGLTHAKVKNPLMVLDEIDKASGDYKGDTAAALLEVLDSEQNSKFVDHYVELAVDLSQVLFLATANDIQSIPKPLLDRMEVIEVSSYTANEKLHIAKEHLLPKQKEIHGLENESLSISDKGLSAIISSYTKEAGVRNLERRLAGICRKAARELLEDKKKKIRVTDKNLEKYLGRLKYRVNPINQRDEVGLVRGLAWTSVGGDTLEIEVNVMPGKGEFVLTGQMGLVMQESAKTGISYIRSIAEKYEIDKEFFAKNDIHIHIPEGAVPKDGPSAGITMAMAILSGITNKKVRADL